METIIPLENELYSDYINRILNSRENVKDKDNYQERHHIIPKCMGGSNDKENLIHLYPEEHYYSHKLLALENQENYGLVAAWHKMQNPVIKNQHRDYIIDAEDFAKARKLFSELHSKRMMGSGNPNYGKTISDKQKQQISQSYKEGKHKATCKKIKNIESNIIFNTCTEAALWCNLSDCSIICKQVKSKRKSAGKHPITGEKLHWVYIE